MSFKPIRTFLTARLLEVDPEFEVYDAAFANDAVGDNDFDKRFHVAYGPINTSVANQNTTQDSAIATVTLYFRGLRDSSESLDEAMDTANKFRINCLRPKWLAAETHVKKVVCNSITPEQLDGNDQQFKVQLQFNINLIYGLGVNLDC